MLENRDPTNILSGTSNSELRVKFRIEGKEELLNLYRYIRGLR